MFSIFKKKHPRQIDLSPLQADMHSHLLPGIDDGAADEAAALQLIKGLQELGYSRLTTTPHILWDLYKNDAHTIQQALQPMQASTPLPLQAAAEYLLDDHFDQLLLGNTPLLTIHDNWVLVEFSFVSPPLDMKEKIFNLQVKGYRPVLAHPERYVYFAADRTKFDELKEAGCLFQLNLLSLAGYYGRQETELAHYLIKKQYVDLLGTDMHHERHLRALQQAGHIMPALHSLLNSGRILNSSL